MNRCEHTPGQVVRRPREADRMLAQGSSVAQVLRHPEATEATHYRWRNQFGAMSPDEAERLKELAAENARLQKLLAEGRW